jgi:hypothetical protein
MEYRIITPTFVGIIRLRGARVLLASPSLLHLIGKPVWEVRELCRRRRWQMIRIQTQESAA